MADNLPAQDNTDAAGSILSSAAPGGGGAPGGGAGGTPKPPADGSTILGGGDGAPPADGKPAGDGKPDGKPAAPEAYAAFTVPDGMTLDAGLVEAFTPLARELGLDQDKAQKLVTLYAEQTAAKLKAAEQAQLTAVKDQRAAWVAEFKASPTWKEDATFARRAVEQIGDDAAKGLLMGSWLGDHPAMLRFLAKVGRALAEDGAGGGSPGGAGGVGKPDPAALFYSTMK